MRVLLTADPELPVPPKLYGGIERIIASLISELLSRGHDVGLVAHPDSQRVPGLQVYPWPARRSQQLSDSLSNTVALWKAIRTFRPEIVHSFSRILYLAPWLGSPLPKIMSFQRPPSATTVRWAARLASKSLTFTGCSEAISRSGRRAGGAWTTVHNFVDLARFDFISEVPAAAPLVFLSRVERIKGAHMAIAACRKANRRLIIAGNHAEDDSESGRYWRDEILPLLGHGGVEYVGPVNDAQKNALLGQAAALIVPIEWEEPFGIVFAEALACGTPVISCPKGALPEIVRDTVDGFLIRGVDEACEAIRRLSEIDRRVCRLRVEESFSSKHIAVRYETLYASRIAARSNTR